MGFMLCYEFSFLCAVVFIGFIVGLREELGCWVMSCGLVLY